MNPTFDRTKFKHVRQWTHFQHKKYVRSLQLRQWGWGANWRHKK